MKKLFLALVFFSIQAKAMGIAGKSGDELLYLYIMFIVLALLIIGTDYLLKYLYKRIRIWKMHKHHLEVDDFHS